MSKSLTIALTTYNRPNYLSKAIKSVLNQTFKDFDLIILDNGSSKIQDMWLTHLRTVE